MSTLADARSPGAPDRSEIIDHIVRMVVPVRREFGKSINVTRMLDDTVYAQSAFDLVLASQNEQLRKQASYLQTAILGPRNATAAQVAHARTAPPTTESEDARRARAETMGKYRSGLR